MLATEISGQTDTSADIIVVGGGLAGLAAATYLAWAGRNVTLFEKAPQVGGRAITHTVGDFLFNQGPHALYRGAGLKVLRELDIKFKGGLNMGGGEAFYGGKFYKLPAGVASIGTSKLLSAKSKIKLAAWLTNFLLKTPTVSPYICLQDWIEQEFSQPDLRNYMLALARLSTYTNAPQILSADLFIAQLKSASKGVYYLDGGWQTLVDGLREAATQAGVKIKSGMRVAEVLHDKTVRGVRLDDGMTLPAHRVLIAGSPAVASSLVDRGQNPILSRWAADALPVKAACLDLGLRRLPLPQRTFALGIDTPFYFSVHTQYAKIGPEGQVVAHVAKYLDPHEHTASKKDELELEAFMDAVQPSWRDYVVEQRFLPKMTVYEALVKNTEGGLSGRPNPRFEEIEGLCLAGDWIGPEGLLADATLASAKRAAHLILNQKISNPLEMIATLG